MEELKSQQGQKLDPEFEKRAKAFMLDVNLMQKKHSIVLRPIITQFGPDMQLMDTKEQPLKK